MINHDFNNNTTNSDDWSQINPTSSSSSSSSSSLQVGPYEHERAPILPAPPSHSNPSHPSLLTPTYIYIYIYPHTHQHNPIQFCAYGPNGAPQPHTGFGLFDPTTAVQRAVAEAKALKLKKEGKASEGTEDDGT